MSALGHSLDGLEEAMKVLGTTNVNDVLKFMSGKEFAANAQAQLMARGGEATKLGRMAGGKLGRNILRAVPLLSTAAVGLDVADIVAGPDSLGNKGMDAGAMTIGGILGAPGGPLGVMAGAGLGKLASDATQFIFGGGKSAEDRKLEEAIKLLQQRGLV